MNAQPVFEFRWFSPLGISVALFLISGGLYVLLGVFAPFLQNRGVGQALLIISPRTDSIVFGKNPPELLRDNAPLAQLRTILFLIMAGLFFLTGCFEIAITWFGLRQGQAWALAALIIGRTIVLLYWFAALRPYFQPGVNLTLGDTPPFMWIPAGLLLPAVILGWRGLA